MRLRSAFGAAEKFAPILVLAALALTGLAPGVAEAASVVGTYDVTVGGMRVGIGGLRANVANNSYTATATVRFAGLARLIADGRGSATSAGSLVGSKVLPNRYSISTSSGRYVQSVRMSMIGGTVRLLTIDPVPGIRPDAIPIAASHRRGIVDPVGALVMPVPGTGDILAPASCDRTLPVFDGRQRYDVTLTYDRMEKVAADAAATSYAGPVLVCRARYRAIAGHRPALENVKQLEASRDLEVWLAPVSGTRILVPWKIAAATPSGRVLIVATQLTIDAKAAAQRADAEGAGLPPVEKTEVAAKRPAP